MKWLQSAKEKLLIAIEMQPSVQFTFDRGLEFKKWVTSNVGSSTKIVSSIHAKYTK